MSKAEVFHGFTSCVAHLYVRIMNGLLPMRRLKRTVV